MESNKNIKKNIIIIIASIVVIIVAVVVGCLFFFKDKSYRVLKIYQVEGQASVIHGDGSEVTPYENMLLQSGDEISLVEGMMVIKADEDKYIYLENHTRIILEATGTAENSKTTIQLLEGAVINQINEALSDKSVYELNTQNATMSVRGTVYRAEVTVESDGATGSSSDNSATESGNSASGNNNQSVSEDGTLVTGVQTFDGIVVTDPLQANGEKSNNEKSVESGKQVKIKREDNKNDYVGDTEDIVFDELNGQTLEYLDMVVQNGEQDIGKTPEELEDLKEAAGPFKVTFIYDKKVFGTVSVNKAEKVEEPLLMPTASGSWQFNFDTPITEDTDIEWKPGN